MAAIIATLAFATDAGAEVTAIRKEDNTDGLDQPTSWVGGLAAPGATEIAQWDSQLTGANTSDLGATASSWLGIKVLNPAGAIGITGTSPANLTLGASGIDMSAATQNLTISSQLLLGSAQTWKVASGRTLNITTPNASAISGTGPLTIQGPGTVRLGALAATYGPITGGITVTGDSGLFDVAAILGGSTMIANGTLVFDMAAIATNTNSGLNLSTPALKGSGGGTIHTIGGARASSGTPAWVQSSSLTLEAGQLNFTQNRGSSARTINQFSSVTRGVGGTANFRDVLSTTDGTANANTGGYRMPASANVNGIVPWVTFTRSTATSSSAAAGTSFFAAVDASNNGTNYAGFTASTTTLGTATQNTNVVTDVALTGATTTNSLRFNDTTARTVTVDPASTLTLGAGAILVSNNGTANHAITSGTLIGGLPGSGSGRDLIIHQLNNTSTFTIGSVIADYSELVGEETVVTPTALTKTGAGKLVLGGANTYTGPTFVNAGPLLVNGALNGSSAVTVFLGGTLGGTGSVTPAVTVNGAIAPGASVGTLTTGTVTFNAGSSLAIELDTTAGTSDKLVVTGGVSTGGNRVNLTLTDVGGNVALANGTKFTLVDYTGTWAGTDLLTYNGVAVANQSTITVGANSYIVDYADAAVDGTALTLTVTGANLTPYTVWANTYASQLPNSADRLSTADPDKDGRTNAMEFALDGDPSSSANTGKMSVSTADSNDGGSDPDLTLTLAVRNGAVLGAGPNGSLTLTVDDIVYTIQGSGNLVDWDKTITEVTPAFALVPAPNTGWTARTFQVSDSNGLPDHRFIRVSITP
jgi:autotransporter-associated beta strand protein